MFPRPLNTEQYSCSTPLKYRSKLTVGYVLATSDFLV